MIKFIGFIDYLDEEVAFFRNPVKEMKSARL